MKEQTELATSKSKGQIVVIQQFQKQLALKPNVELCLYPKEQLATVKSEFSTLANIDQFSKKI